MLYFKAKENFFVKLTWKNFQKFRKSEAFVCSVLRTYVDVPFPAQCECYVSAFVPANFDHPNLKRFHKNCLILLQRWLRTSLFCFLLELKNVNKSAVAFDANDLVLFLSSANLSPLGLVPGRFQKALWNVLAVLSCILCSFWMWIRPALLISKNYCS